MNRPLAVLFSAITGWVLGTLAPAIWAEGLGAMLVAMIILGSAFARLIHEPESIHPASKKEEKE